MIIARSCTAGFAGNVLFAWTFLVITAESDSGFDELSIDIQHLEPDSHKLVEVRYASQYSVNWFSTQTPGHKYSEMNHNLLAFKESNKHKGHYSIKKRGKKSKNLLVHSIRHGCLPSSQYAPRIFAANRVSAICRGHGAVLADCDTTAPMFHAPHCC